MLNLVTMYHGRALNVTRLHFVILFCSCISFCLILCELLLKLQFSCYSYIINFLIFKKGREKKLRERWRKIERKMSSNSHATLLLFQCLASAFLVFHWLFLCCWTSCHCSNNGKNEKHHLKTWTSIMLHDRLRCFVSRIYPGFCIFWHLQCENCLPATFLIRIHSNMLNFIIMNCLNSTIFSSFILIAYSICLFIYLFIFS